VRERDAHCCYAVSGRSCGVMATVLEFQEKKWKGREREDMECLPVHEVDSGARK